MFDGNERVATSNGSVARIIATQIDTGAALTDSAIALLNNICDAAEDAGPHAILLVELDGSRETATGTTAGAAPSQLLGRWERVVRRIERAACPTAAIVKGFSAGVGLALMLATDFRIAAPGAEFGLANNAGAIEPGMALYRLATELGVARARRMVLFGERIGAEQAREWGLVDEVGDFAFNNAPARLAALVEHVDAGYVARRQLLLEAPSSPYESALGLHLAACEKLYRQTCS
jgi:isomerase DpgB